MDINKYLEARRELRAILREIKSDSLIPLFGELFDALPVVAVGWSQYTPAFNDGDPCEFITGEPQIAYATGVGRCAACWRPMRSPDDRRETCPGSEYWDSYKDAGRCRFKIDWTADDEAIWEDWADTNDCRAAIGTVMDAGRDRHTAIDQFLDAVVALDDVFEHLFGNDVFVIVSRLNGEFRFDIQSYEDY